MALTKINSSVIANNTIAVGNIADNSVDATKIASNSILTRHIDDNQIGIDQLNVSDGSNGQFLKTNGSGTLSFATVSSAADDITTGDAAVTIGTSSGTITLDAASTVKLDAGNDEIHLLGSGTEFGKLFRSSSNFYINNPTQDKDIIFSGNDDGSTITALTLDMSDAGSAFFNSDVYVDRYFRLRTTDDQANQWLLYTHTNDNLEINYNGSGNAEVVVDTSGKVGIGTTSPSTPLHISHGSSTVGLYTIGGYNYQAKFESSDAEAAIVIEDSNSTNDANRIGVITNDMTFITNNSERMRIDASGTIRQHYATDNGSNKRYTAPLNPRIAQVGLQMYVDPTKATDGTDFSPSTHGNGNQDLTLGSGVSHVTNSNRAVWQFDGTSNASMYGNPNLSAYKSASFSMWVYWNDVTSLNGGYQLNGIQIGNHYMYIGIVQGANDSAPLYGYAGQGTNIPAGGGADQYEQAYVNSDEWVYLTIQFGHGSSDVTSRTKGRAEVYLNGALVQRINEIALPTVAANSSSSFYLGRVQGGYYLNGYVGPAVLYERTLHQWEILENMRVHADMYMS